MSLSRIFSIAVFIILLSNGCSITGHYTTNPKSKMAFAGYEIILTKNQTFRIHSWSDNYTKTIDSLGNEIWTDNKHQGLGTFQKRGDTLDLIFLNEDSITVIINKTIDKVDSYKLSILNERHQFINPVVSLKNDSLITKETIWAKSKEQVIFEIPRQSDILNIGFDLIHNQGPQINIPLNKILKGKNIFKFKTFNGYFSHGEKSKLYCKRTWKGIRYGPHKKHLTKK